VAWLNLFNRPTPTPVSPTTEAVVPEVPSNFLLVESGASLLQQGDRSRKVTAIKRTQSVTSEVWAQHYLYAIERFAELVQNHPASRNHHHSESGGLLDHTLDTLYRAMRLSAGYILPPQAEPEDIALNQERWRFGIFITALLHDVGKIITDQETVFRHRGELTRWQPWFGPMPQGAHYTYRYRQTNGEHYAGLHDRAGITILPFVLTQKASEWLASDRRLMSQIFNALSASTLGAGVVGEIVKAADRASTGNNLSTSTGSQSDETPLHIKILSAIQTLSSEGRFKRNMPGSAVWVDESFSWFSANSVMTSVRAHLIENGHKGIPQSPRRLTEIMNEHKVTVEPSDTSSVFEAKIHDSKRNWNKTLTFFVISNEKVWLNGTPSTFDGTITPVDKKGNPIAFEPTDHASTPADISNEQEPQVSTEDPANIVQETTEPSGAPSSAPFSWSEPEAESDETGAVSTSSESLVVEEGVQAKSDQSTAQADPSVAPKLASYQSSRKAISKPTFRNIDAKDLTKESDFFKWLINGIRYHRVRINESGAPVHIVGKELALISPAIFQKYLSDNKAAALSLGASMDEQRSALQRTIKSLGKHRRKDDQSDFHKIIISGPNRQSTVSAMLFDRALFPDLETISANPILHIDS